MRYLILLIAVLAAAPGCRNPLAQIESDVNASRPPSQNLGNVELFAAAAEKHTIELQTALRKAPESDPVTRARELAAKVAENLARLRPAAKAAAEQAAAMERRDAALEDKEAQLLKRLGFALGLGGVGVLVVSFWLGTFIRKFGFFALLAGSAMYTAGAYFRVIKTTVAVAYLAVALFALAAMVAFIRSFVHYKRNGRTWGQALKRVLTDVEEIDLTPDEPFKK